MKFKKGQGESIPHSSRASLCSRVSVLLSGGPNTIDGLLKKKQKIPPLQQHFGCLAFVGIHSRGIMGADYLFWMRGNSIPRVRGEKLKCVPGAKQSSRAETWEIKVLNWIIAGSDKSPTNSKTSRADKSITRWNRQAYCFSSEVFFCFTNKRLQKITAHTAISLRPPQCWRLGVKSRSRF